MLNCVLRCRQLFLFSFHIFQYILVLVNITFFLCLLALEESSLVPFYLDVRQKVIGINSVTFLNKIRHHRIHVNFLRLEISLLLCVDLLYYDLPHFLHSVGCKIKKCDFHFISDRQRIEL